MENSPLKVAIHNVHVPLFKKLHESMLESALCTCTWNKFLVVTSQILAGLI